MKFPSCYKAVLLLTSSSLDHHEESQDSLEVPW